ncbi:hypothetical protein BJY04DRAFT_221801 [Aspergillus karnatakaensis]|uniref:uncharacterized protein n=1 Tax=Aspergillus karnatakaensis TaxID=1810916 RepID=UPI003CCE2527
MKLLTALTYSASLAAMLPDSAQAAPTPVAPATHRVEIRSNAQSLEGPDLSQRAELSVESAGAGQHSETVPLEVPEPDAVYNEETGAGSRNEPRERNGRPSSFCVVM